MQINIRDDSNIPIYQQLVEAISQDIAGGRLQPGYKLPTVRDLAEEAGISRGTVKHAYDRLENLGLIEMTQGRGTFVCERTNEEQGSKKDRAMQVIDEMLDEMHKLSFSMRDIRIFFDLKVREREERYPFVRVAAVDCNPEALLVIHTQLSTFPNVDVQSWLLSDVMAHPEKLEDDPDLIVTTSTHFAELEYKVPSNIPLMRMVLTISTDTIMNLARLSDHARVGIITSSNQYAALILRGCAQFSSLKTDPQVYLLGSHGSAEKFAANLDVLIVPPNYHTFCSAAEEAVVSRFFSDENKTVISYEYQIDHGSFLYIGEEVDKIYREHYSTI